MKHMGYRVSKGGSVYRVKGSSKRSKHSRRKTYWTKAGALRAARRRG